MSKVYALLVMVLLLVTGCTGLKRGLDGTTFVSTSKPALSVAVPSLPLRTGGQVTAQVTSDSAVGGTPVQAWLAVYGGNSVDEPMAVVAYAEVPPAYYWDADLSRIFSINKGVALIGEQGFQACTYIVEARGDAFVTLVATDKPETLRWIVRRFAVRTEFDQGKLTLEYREKLPADVVSLTDLPQGANSFIRDFEDRAQKVFVFGAVSETANTLRTTYPQGVRTRYLNTNFFGTMSTYQYFD